MVAVQVLPDDVQPTQVVDVAPLPGVAVSNTELPTAYVAMHVPGQLIPAGRLVTDPLPTTPTLSVANFPPPGQRGSLGLSTVTVA